MVDDDIQTFLANARISVNNDIAVGGDLLTKLTQQVRDLQAQIVNAVARLSQLQAEIARIDFITDKLK